jgi:hypothetical protein
VSHWALASCIKKYFKAKKELWKFKYFTMQALQPPNKIKFEIVSNSMAHKLADSPRGMCQFKHYLSTMKMYATIKS